MIIRKPYAVLIKHFRLIHSALLAMMIYLIYRTSKITQFFLEYFSDEMGVIGKELTDGLFNDWMYFLTFVVILGLVAVLILMITKQKPVKYYIGAIISYIALLVILNMDHSVIASMESELLSARTVRAMSDVTWLLLGIQSLMIILTFIRATGFDIKQLDFEKDLQELKITEEDREEVEVGLDVDSGKIQRQIRKQIRHMKYVYLENKLLCNVLIVVAILLTGYFIYDKSGMNEKIYKQNQFFQTASFVMNVEDSYITNTNYKLEKLNDQKTLLVLRLKVRTIYDREVSMDTARLEVTIKDHKYYPTESHTSDISDFGTSYRGEKIGKEEQFYVLCYEIPSNYINEPMLFQYVQSVSGIKNKLEITYQKVKLSPINLGTTPNRKKYKLTEKVDMSGSILGDTKFVIQSYEIKPEFKFTYNFCPANNECHQSVEYIKPNILTNDNKVLLRLNGLVQSESAYLDKKHHNLFQFINQYGMFRYK
ncbi:MAG: hypothetical protein HFH31_03360, partial [Bacilli bacterium]|nr:hypothetical protein [Bacilli bacterium]